MPKFSRRRRTRRRTPWYRKKYSLAQMAGKAYKGMKYIRKLINVERKFLDTTQAATTQTNVATIAPLSYIAEGDDYNSRDGHSILTQGMLFRMRMTANSTAVVNFIRVMVFIDKEMNGTAPVVGDILEATTDYLSPIQHDAGKRFKILFDRIFSLDYNGRGTAAINKWFRINHHIKYTGTTAAAASSKEGQLYVLTLSDNTSNPPGYSWYNRIRFTDN